MDRKLFDAVLEYDKGDAKRIQHLIKVYTLSHYIAECEGFSEEELKALDAAAMLHDIGIHEGERLYGRNDGKIQEELGPDIARGILRKVGGYEKYEERIAYIIAHHHTYTDIDGMDLQILIEADFLVNLYEDNCSDAAVKSAAERMFKTSIGKRLIAQMYGI